jgi:ATP-dependent NAD(P)H-hydrate dehydratase
MMLDVPNSASEALIDFIEADIVSEFKSCGGQGTILSDTIAAFLVWGKCHEDGTLGNQEVPSSRIPLLAAVAGCMVTRKANRFAFKKEKGGQSGYHGRGEGCVGGGV